MLADDLTGPRSQTQLRQLLTHPLLSHIRGHEGLVTVQQVWHQRDMQVEHMLHWGMEISVEDVGVSNVGSYLVWRCHGESEG